MASKRKGDKAHVATLVTKEAATAPIHLDTAQRRVLDDALREGESFREDVESAILKFGRFLLDRVFGGNTTAALDVKTRNPVWLELQRRAGGPTLAVSRHALYTALRIAANDKRIADRSWRGLDVGRKELLLPLGTDQRLREGAQHVSQWNLTQRKTREYVASVLAEAGQKKKARLTGASLLTRVKSAQKALAAPEVLRRVRDLKGELSAAEREEVTRELTALRDSLSLVVKALRAR